VDYLKREWEIKAPKLKKSISKMGKKAASVQEVENLYDFLKENFVTKQDVLDQFQQNEEKKYEDGEEDL